MKFSIHLEKVETNMVRGLEDILEEQKGQESSRNFYKIFRKDMKRN